MLWPGDGKAVNRRALSLVLKKNNDKGWHRVQHSHPQRPLITFQSFKLTWLRDIGSHWLSRLSERLRIIPSLAMPNTRNMCIGFAVHRIIIGYLPTSITTCTSYVLADMFRLWHRRSIAKGAHYRNVCSCIDDKLRQATGVISRQGLELK